MTPPSEAAGDPAADGSARLAHAESLLDLVYTNVNGARAQALELLAQDAQDEAAAVASRVLGLSIRFSDAAEACEQLRRAVKLSTRLGLTVRAAQARTSLVVLLSQVGRTRAALREATIAEEELRREDAQLDLARLRVNHGLVLQRIGRNAEALEFFNVAKPVLRAHRDTRWEALLCSLRGTLLAYQGRGDLAIADLARGIKLARASEQRALLYGLHANLGFSLSRQGRIPDALKEIAEALRLAEQGGVRPDAAYADRADALMAVGLAAEALESAERAIAGQLDAGRAFDASESRLMAARAALALKEVARSSALAAQARADFTRQRRYTWAAWAWQVELAARFAEGRRTPELLRELTRCVARLERAGWLSIPQQARLLAARTAAEVGRGAEAQRLYTQIAQERSNGLFTMRILAWEAEAELRLLRGDRSGAGRAVTQGMKVLAQYAGTLGATDLRAGSATLGTELATTGLRLGLESGSARSLLVRAEQWRAASLRRTPVRPAQSGRVAELLGKLRDVTSQITDEALEGKEVRPLQRERIKLEDQIRDLARHAPGGAGAPESSLDIRALGEALSGRALVEYVRLDDELHAVVLADGRCTRHRIGSYQAVLWELDSLRFAMGRIAEQHGPQKLLAAAQQSYQHARATLDRILLDPVRGRIGATGELVLVPTGSLHALAWAVLPGLEGRVLTIAPSARNWLMAERVPDRRGGHVALAHGPGLPHAEAEISSLAELYRDAKPLRGEDASAEAVADSWDGASLAHIAAHGRFRNDNPLFSNLELANGPLTVYDLESLGKAPRVLILSACNAALSGIHPGDELMGVTSALLTLGSKTLIASVAPVPDEHTRVLMMDLHRRLGEGMRPAHALAQAQANHREAPAFICLGAG